VLCVVSSQTNRCSHLGSLLVISVRKYLQDVALQPRSWTDIYKETWMSATRFNNTGNNKTIGPTECLSLACLHR